MNVSVLCLSERTKRNFFGMFIFSVKFRVVFLFQMFMLRVQANQCKIDSFAISLNTKKRSHVSEYGSIERELLSARAPTSQHTHAHVFRSGSLTLSLAFCVYAWNARTVWMRVSWSCHVRTHSAWKSVCVCVLVFTLPLNRAWTALSHIDMHTPSREREKYSALIFSNVPSPWEFLCIWFYCCCFVSHFCSLDVAVTHEPKTTFSRWILRIDTLRRYTINRQYIKFDFICKY